MWRLSIIYKIILGSCCWTELSVRDAHVPAGDMFGFPKGLVHWQDNKGTKAKHVRVPQRAWFTGSTAKGTKAKW
jgi:quercetin dioxygenase-like cupin family protein